MDKPKRKVTTIWFQGSGEPRNFYRIVAKIFGLPDANLLETRDLRKLRAWKKNRLEADLKVDWDKEPILENAFWDENHFLFRLTNPPYGFSIELLVTLQKRFSSVEEAGCEIFGVAFEAPDGFDEDLITQIAEKARNKERQFMVLLKGVKVLRLADYRTLVTAERFLPQTCSL